MPSHHSLPPHLIGGGRKKQGTDKDRVQWWLHLAALYFVGFKSGVAYHLHTDDGEQTFRLKSFSSAPVSDWYSTGATGPAQSLCLKTLHPQRRYAWTLHQSIHTEREEGGAGKGKEWGSR